MGAVCLESAGEMQNGENVQQATYLVFSGPDDESLQVGRAPLLVYPVSWIKIAPTRTCSWDYGSPGTEVPTVLQRQGSLSPLAPFG